MHFIPPPAGGRYESISPWQEGRRALAAGVFRASWKRLRTRQTGSETRTGAAASGQTLIAVSGPRPPWVAGAQKPRGRTLAGAWANSLGDGSSRRRIVPALQRCRTASIRGHRRKPPANAFQRRYTPHDAALLAEVDEAFDQPSGPASKVVLQRMHEVYGDERFARLASVSNGHIDHLRKTRAGGRGAQPAPHRRLHQVRPRHPNDNALVETKNGSVVRKWLGHVHVPHALVPRVNAFLHDHLCPFLNFHRPCLFPTEVTSPTGRVRRRYRQQDVATPYERFKALPGAEAFLRPGVTLGSLDRLAAATTDLAAAQAVRRARDELFRAIGKAGNSAA